MHQDEKHTLLYKQFQIIKKDEYILKHLSHQMLLYIMHISLIIQLDNDQKRHIRGE